MYIKHFLGFLTLYFFIVLIDKEHKSPAEKLKNSILIYFAFIMSTKLHYMAWIPFIIVISTIYILYIVKDQIEYSPEKISEEKKLNSDNTKGHIALILKIQTVLSIIAIIILIFGFVYYLGEKKIEYHKNFDYLSFLFSNANCKLDTPKINGTLLDVLAVGFNPKLYKK
jgi:NADH:ubiquinone oxidoreductase subunit 5 (subunit L)/multisubunit Na+/H+ antiporter MnhA subunit